MKTQLTPASLSWAHWLNYGNSQFQLITLENEILSIPIAQSWKVVQRNNGSPNQSQGSLGYTYQFLSKLPLEWVLLFTHTPPLCPNSAAFLSTQPNCYIKTTLKTPYFFIIFFNQSLHYATWAVYIWERAIVQQKNKTIYPKNFMESDHLGQSMVGYSKGLSLMAYMFCATSGCQEQMWEVFTSCLESIKVLQLNYNILAPCDDKESSFLWVSLSSSLWSSF